jgi:hypothetical protein
MSAGEVYQLGRYGGAGCEVAYFLSRLGAALFPFVSVTHLYFGQDYPRKRIPVFLLRIIFTPQCGNPEPFFT